MLLNNPTISQNNNINFQKDQEEIEISQEDLEMILEEEDQEISTIIEETPEEKMANKEEITEEMIEGKVDKEEKIDHKEDNTTEKKEDRRDLKEEMTDLIDHHMIEISIEEEMKMIPDHQEDNNKLDMNQDNNIDKKEIHQ